MSLQQLQETRFEYKYIIPEHTAFQVRDFARSYLVPDPHAHPISYDYCIHSLYLDDPGLALYRATMTGVKNRFKLRIRYYNNDPDSPLFFEIKRRVNDAILKRRASIRRESLQALLDGHWPHRTDLADPTEGRGLDAASEFCNLRGRINALPQVIVSYIREAWVTEENNSVRLTFDRSLTATKWDGRCLANEVFHGGLRPRVGGVVLELKFTGRFPNWMREMTQALNLRRGQMAKYTRCIEAMQAGPLAAHPILTEAYV